MGFLTAALLIGAGSAAVGAVGARKERKANEAAMQKNENAARENAKLNQTKDGTGADIVLGTDEGADAAKSKRKATPRSPKTVKPPTVGTTVGGAFGIPNIGTAAGLR